MTLVDIIFTKLQNTGLLVPLVPTGETERRVKEHISAAFAEETVCPEAKNSKHEYSLAIMDKRVVIGRQCWICGNVQHFPHV